MSTPASPRTVVVTGASRGLGAEIARAFHAAGDEVVLVSRVDRALAAELGSRARFLAADVRRPAELHAAARGAFASTGRLDVWVNNAGYSRWCPLPEVDEPFWDDMLATNLKGAFFGAQAAAAYLPAGGSIINVSSLAGKRGSANNAVYCASKFGVNGVTQALAKELGGRGLRVNAVCPVFVESEGLLEALAEPAAPPLGGDIPSYLQSFASTQAALGRLPRAHEVAQACVFLASAAASAITGQCLNVDCGVLPQ